MKVHHSPLIQKLLSSPEGRNALRTSIETKEHLKFEGKIYKLQVIGRYGTVLEESVSPKHKNHKKP